MPALAVPSTVAKFTVTGPATVVDGRRTDRLIVPVSLALYGEPKKASAPARSSSTMVTVPVVIGPSTAAAVPPGAPRLTVKARLPSWRVLPIVDTLNVRDITPGLNVSEPARL